MSNKRITYMAALSHELQIPTLAQLRALELLLDEKLGSLNSEQKELLELTKNSCNHLYSMIKTLQSAYLFEGDETALTYEVFNINILVAEAITELSYLVEENMIKIHFVSQYEAGIVSADSFALKRVIINVLYNAITFARPASDIYIMVKCKCNKVMLLVTDLDSYIDSKKLNDICSKYVSNSMKYNKVGAVSGLYLAKKIIELHHGKIITKSFGNNTNSFGFIFPIHIDTKKDGH